MFIGLTEAFVIKQLPYLPVKESDAPKKKAD